MTQLLSKRLALITGEDRMTVAFFCPGCKEEHMVWIGEGSGPRWSYNGDPERPTFQPSLLITSGHFVTGNEDGRKGCWCTYYAENPEERRDFECRRCHSFITDGRIQFLDDCSHELKGQTVEIPDYPYKEKQT
jgi:hypothetical protein